MNTLSYILLGVVIVAVAIAVFFIIRGKTGGCSGCSGNCSNCKKHRIK